MFATGGVLAAGAVMAAGAGLVAGAVAFCAGADSAGRGLTTIGGLDWHAVNRHAPPTTTASNRNDDVFKESLPYKVRDYASPEVSGPCKRRLRSG